MAADYGAQLDPAPFDALNRDIVINSVGHVAAKLDGLRLTITGDFSKLSSPAVGASIRIGLAKGVPGDTISALTVERQTAGTVQGAIKLNPAQAEALVREALYVRIDSEKAPDGEVQGWLEGIR